MLQRLGRDIICRLLTIDTELYVIISSAYASFQIPTNRLQSVQAQQVQVLLQARL
jgi:hypothetical protein